MMYFAWVPAGAGCTEIGALEQLWVWLLGAPSVVSDQCVPCVYVLPLFISSSVLLCYGVGTRWCVTLSHLIVQHLGLGILKSRLASVIDIAVALVEYASSTHVYCVYLLPSLDSKILPLYQN